MRIAGAVLTGGASTRMGRTKATIPVDGRPLAERVLDAARAVGSDPLFLVGGDASELSVLTAPMVPDRFPGDGPVGGVLTALEHARSTPDPVDAVFVLACDLIDLDAATLNALVASARKEPNAVVWVATTGRLEPACALWSVAAHGAVEAAFARGERALHRVVSTVPHATAAVEPAAMRNANRPNDLRGGASAG